MGQSFLSFVRDYRILLSMTKKRMPKIHRAESKSNYEWEFIKMIILYGMEPLRVSNITEGILKLMIDIVRDINGRQFELKKYTQIC